MNGMIWFDNSPKKSLAQKITEAAKYYLEKYGIVANTCWLHPSMISNAPAQALPETIRLRPSRACIPNNMVVGRV